MTDDAPPPPPPASPPPPAGDPPPAAARPDFIPEKYWDAKNPLPPEVLQHPTLVNLGKGYVEAAGKIGQQRETIAKEIEAERRKGAPAKVEEYKAAVAEGVKDLVILDKPPGEDFQAEPGKTYAILKADSPLLKSAAAAAHKYGMPQAEFSALVTDLAREMGTRIPTAEEAAAAQTEFYKSLGERGEERVRHLNEGLKAAIGDKAAALDLVGKASAAQIEAIEALLEKTGQPKLSAGPADTGPPLTRAQLQEIMDSPDYSVNPDKQRRVNEGYAKLFPGKRDLANPSAAG